MRNNSTDNVSAFEVSFTSSIFTHLVPYDYHILRPFTGALGGKKYGTKRLRLKRLCIAGYRVSQKNFFFFWSRNLGISESVTELKITLNMVGTVEK